MVNSAPSRPQLRGWLHLGTFPAAITVGLVFALLAPSRERSLAVAIFAVTAALLFGVSAIYHRGRWSARTRDLLQRWDHANIFLIIAGTYTPFAFMLLPPPTARIALLTVWVGAAMGVAFGILWPRAPRWLSVPAYVALGWVAIGYLPQFFANGGVAVTTLIIVGGALYTLGAVVYALKWPDPSPRWFGFHEVFHAFTVAAFIVHCIAMGLAIFTVT